MQHLVSCEQFTRKTLEKLFSKTDDIRENMSKYSSALSDKVVATIFYEPSTRTRLSFESAISRLGGHIISTENAREFSSAIKGESLEDTIRTMNGYCDAIIIRHYDVNSAKIAAKVSNVPILNAGAGSGEHPTQSLLDVYTLQRRKGHIDGLSVAVLGDLLYGRTIHSLLRLLSLYDNITIYALPHKELPLPEEYERMLAERNVKLVKCSSFNDIPSNLDAFYHTRIQKERIRGDLIDNDNYIQMFNLTSKVMRRFSKDTLILHPLPRNEEISVDLDDDPRAVFFEQAHNGVFVRMALLHHMLCEVKR